MSGAPPAPRPTPRAQALPRLDVAAAAAVDLPPERYSVKWLRANGFMDIEPTPAAAGAPSARAPTSFTFMSSSSSSSSTHPSSSSTSSSLPRLLPSNPFASRSAPSHRYAAAHTRVNGARPGEDDRFAVVAALGGDKGTSLYAVFERGSGKGGAAGGVDRSSCSRLVGCLERAWAAASAANPPGPAHFSPPPSFFSDALADACAEDGDREGLAQARSTGADCGGPALVAAAPSCSVAILSLSAGRLWVARFGGADDALLVRGRRAEGAAAAPPRRLPGMAEDGKEDEEKEVVAVVDGDEGMGSENRKRKRDGEGEGPSAAPSSLLPLASKRPRAAARVSVSETRLEDGDVALVLATVGVWRAMDAEDAARLVVLAPPAPATAQAQATTALGALAPPLLAEPRIVADRLLSRSLGRDAGGGGGGAASSSSSSLPLPLPTPTAASAAAGGQGGHPGALPEGGGETVLVVDLTRPTTAAMMTGAGGPWGGGGSRVLGGGARLGLGP
jgi:hypothetical protein